MRVSISIELVIVLKRDPMLFVVDDFVMESDNDQDSGWLTLTEIRISQNFDIFSSLKIINLSPKLYTFIRLVVDKNFFSSNWLINSS